MSDQDLDAEINKAIQEMWRALNENNFDTSLLCNDEIKGLSVYQIKKKPKLRLIRGGKKD
jgi:hypothetical protein